MRLHKPFEITSRLLPGLRVADGTLALELSGERPDGKPIWGWYIDIPAGEFYGRDLCGWGGTQNMFGSLLAFLSAAAESYAYHMRTGRDSDNTDLFPAEVVEWAYQNSDELEALRFEIEESGEVLIAD